MVAVAKLAAVAVRQTELYRRLSPNAPPLRLPEGPPSWYFGAVLSASILGGLVGAAVAPALRRQVAEERILAASTLIAALGGVLAVVVDGLVGLVGFAGLVAVSAALGKQAFDPSCSGVRPTPIAVGCSRVSSPGSKWPGWSAGSFPLR